MTQTTNQSEGIKDEGTQGPAEGAENLARENPVGNRPECLFEGVQGTVWLTERDELNRLADDCQMICRCQMYSLTHRLETRGKQLDGL